MLTRSRTATVVAGLFLAPVAAQSVGLLLAGMPVITAPASLVVILPLFSDVPLVVVLAVPPILFWAWAPHLFSGRHEVPKRTIWLFRILVTLSIAWFLVGWKYGLQYEGLGFTVGTATISLLCAALIALLLRRSRRSSSFEAALAATWLIFAWVLTFAFPYLGETP
jgi:hypothetical protein